MLLLLQVYQSQAQKELSIYSQLVFLALIYSEIAQL